MKLLSFLIFFLSSILSGAQAFENLPVNLIDQSAGLLTTDNRFCYMDSKGILWFSSVAGLHRFDGNQIARYSPSNKDSTSLKGHNVNGLFFEDEDHNIWFSTTEAINCYLRKKDSFKAYRYPGTINGTYFTCGLESSGQLWFFTDSLLLTFDIHEHTFKVRAKLRTEAQRGLILLNSTGQVSHAFLYSLDRSHPGFQMITFNSQGAAQSSMHFNGIVEPTFPVRDLYIQQDSLLWMASRAGIFSFNIFTHQYLLYNPVPGLNDIYINAIEGLNDSTLFLTSYARGAFIFNLNSRKFTNQYQLVSGGQIISEHPQEIYSSSDGGIWISIPGKGIAFFHPGNLVFRSFQYQLTTSIAHSSINPNTFIELPDQSVWGSSNNHGGFLLNNNLEIIKQYHKDYTRGWMYNNTFLSMMDDLDQIWTLTAGAPCVLYPDEHVVTVTFNTPESFYSLCKSTQEYMILGSLEGGIFRSVKTGKYAVHLEKIKSVDSNTVFSFLYLHADSKVYGSVYQSHIDVLDPENQFKLLYHLPFKADVQCMVPDDHHEDILIGTDRGVYLYKPIDHSLDSLDWFDENFNLIVYGIVPTEHQYVWISTNNGIYSLDIDHKTYTRFGIENGTGALNFNRNAFLHRTTGEIWFGSNEGFTVIDPSQVQLRVPNVQVMITKLFVNDAVPPSIKCSETGSTNISEFSSIRLPFQKNTISLEFASISYSGINHAHYEYRLLGSEERWVQAGNRGFARYANLPAGPYTFEVRSKNNAFNNQNPITSLKILIIPPLYQRWWFVSVSVALLSLLLFWMYTSNERRKQKLVQLEFEKRIALESERLRIANDMHDDLGSGLSALSLRAKLLAQQAEQPELKSQMNDFVNSASRLAQIVRETIWTINSKNDSVDNLVTRLHQYALEYFNGTAIHCSVDLLQEQVQTSISGYHRRELYLAYKEALHNVVKHAVATTVNISIDLLDSHRLVIQIRDNGKGFDQAEQGDGLGLSSMQKHMENIGGRFHIHSDIQGTQITLTYPL